jgi:hypothetical protein
MASYNRQFPAENGQFPTARLAVTHIFKKDGKDRGINPY